MVMYDCKKTIVECHKCSVFSSADPECLQIHCNNSVLPRKKNKFTDYHGCKELSFAVM